MVGGVARNVVVGTVSSLGVAGLVVVLVATVVVAVVSFVVVVVAGVVDCMWVISK